MLDLYFHVEGCSELWEALVGLSLAYGVELPGRTEGWREAQGRKADYQRARYKALGAVLKRRMFKVCVMPHLDGIEDPAEHDEAVKVAWEEFGSALFWPALAEAAVG